jgi:hypothetical protein
MATDDRYGFSTASTGTRTLAFARVAMAFTRVISAVYAFAASVADWAKRWREDAERDLYQLRRVRYGFAQSAARLPRSEPVLVFRCVQRREPSASEHKQLSWLNRLHGPGVEALA